MSTLRTGRRGRHELTRVGWTARGRHAAVGPVSPLVATMVRFCLLVVPVSILIGIVATVSLPKATSNASSGQDESADATVESSVEAVVSSTRICPIDWQQSTWHVKKLIRCAAAYYNVSSSKALYIAWRESRYLPTAYNQKGDAAGIYQHVMKYWPDRAETYGFPDSSAFNARANIIVTMRMVHRIGWSPWAM